MRFLIAIAIALVPLVAGNYLQPVTFHFNLSNQMSTDYIQVTLKVSIFENSTRNFSLVVAEKLSRLLKCFQKIRFNLTGRRSRQAWQYPQATIRLLNFAKKKK